MTRVADIRRMARKAGLPKFGEEHVRAGTSADDFFKIVAKRAAASPEELRASKNARGYDRGRAAAKAIFGRKSNRLDEDTGATINDKDETDDDEDRDEEETCPTCGKPISDDHDDDKDEDDQRDDDDADGENARAYLSGRTGTTRAARGAAAAKKLLKR